MPGRLAITDTLPLKHSGAKIPMLGFGVWASPTGKCTTSCLNALGAGYRHIDTAQVYGNETEVGLALEKCGLPREEVFITTKFFSEKPEEEVYQSALESIKKCDPRPDGYVDLFLIHQPKSGASGRKMLWQILERLVAEGKAKSIGVSNFSGDHIEAMKSYAKIWPPSVNQIELHPFLQQKEVVKYCEDNGIVVEAYCPIVRNQRANDPTLGPMAKELGVNPNQVLLRYCLQKNWVPLPKSDDPGRMKMNADLYSFELSPKQMEALDALDEGDKAAICPENLPHTIP